jgi:hypothetical protein
MNPVNFPEANSLFGAPAGLDEKQVATIRAFQHEIVGGSCDGLKQVVVAWKPTETELARIAAGEPIFISMIGCLVPHYLSTSFHEATHPA